MAEGTRSVGGFQKGQCLCTPRSLSGRPTVVQRRHTGNSCRCRRRDPGLLPSCRSSPGASASGARGCRSRWCRNRPSTGTRDGEGRCIRRGILSIRRIDRQQRSRCRRQGRSRIRQARPGYVSRGGPCSPAQVGDGPSGGDRDSRADDPDWHYRTARGLHRGDDPPDCRRGRATTDHGPVQSDLEDRGEPLGSGGVVERAGVHCHGQPVCGCPIRRQVDSGVTVQQRLCLPRGGARSHGL